MDKQKTMTVENFPHLTRTDKDLLGAAIAANMRYARIKATPAIPNGYVLTIGLGEGVTNPTHAWRSDLGIWLQIASADGVPIRQTERGKKSGGN